MRYSSPPPFSASASATTMLGLFVVLFCQKISLVQSQSLPLLLVVSFDGFRHDYSTVYGPLKNFRRIEEHGVRTHSMIPTFTTSSIPNHYSLVTGVYQEVHGLIAEEMFDRRTNRTFSSRSNSNSSEQWWPIEPIWTLNEQRKEARSGVIGWPQNNIRAKKSEPFRQDRPMKEMIDRMLQWFNDPTEPINFGAIYFDEPATTGFRSGPFSSSMSRTIQLCDEHLGYLLDEIDKNTRLRNNLHLIVTSSQGMEQVNRTDFPVYLDDFVDMRKVNVFGSSTLMNIFLKSSKNDPDQTDVMRNLSRIPISRCYRPEDLPVRFHYKHPSRLGDFILLAQPGYEILRRQSNDGRWNTTHGNVGYDNELEAMKTIFYASGPQFKENFSLPSSQPLHLVDLFPLMCSLLNLHPCRPSNGSLKNIQPFLIDPFRTLNLTEKESEKLHDGPMGLVIYLLVLVSFVLILIMAVVWSAVSFRHGTTFLRTAQNDPNTFDEQNQYKFTQINDRKLNSAIGNDNL